MTDEVYKQATKLRETDNLLKRVSDIMNFPYPELRIFKRMFSLSYAREELCVDFVNLDEKTSKELKEAILNVVSKRRKEIENELDQL